MINVAKLFQEATQSQCNDQRDSRFDGGINLHKVKLEVDSCTWTDFTQPGNRQYCNRVNIAGPAVGQVQTGNENPNFIKVTLEKGMVHGLNRQLRLPLDSGRQDLIREFDSFVTLDPSRGLYKPIHGEKRYGVSVGGPVGPGGATATVCKTGNDYKGHFSCRVIMKGKGMSSQGEQRIGDAIKYLKSKQPQNPDLKVLNVDWRNGENVVVFTMEGELECKWGYNYTAEWKS